ncbi:response regulator [Alishewanella sp. WH16-1]|uniref:response regulator n=1 Tax=Alishewanella sp. WH16-1 TaxID=1651088 RepID=UPI00070FD48D|nr:response regulator [Alishewanella sp. WH16-1]KRS22980.1 response regulator [Alishewanella sp. WH16-1]
MEHVPKRDERILIIDEQQLSQSYLRYTLEQLGYQNITIADRAQLALNLCRNNLFDLIICSFNQAEGKDGFQLFAELKFSGLQKHATALIFISAETDPTLVHSVIELQPDEFLAKPFAIKDLQLRIERVLKRKQQLRPLYQLLDNQQYPSALRHIDEQLSDASQHKWFPLLLKLKGDILLAQQDYEDAEHFFLAMLSIQPFSWARMGLVRCYMQQGREQQAFNELEPLLLRTESRLFALDLLSELEFKQQRYQQAQQHLIDAAELAPRNLLRQQKLLQLSRLNHDYETQYRAAKDMVKYARYSMFEQPDLYLNLARASIDYALASEDEEQQSRLNRQVTLSLQALQKQFGKQDLSEQQLILQARLLYLQDHKDKAKALLRDLKNDQPISSLEDALDKAKALHELGLADAAEQLFQQISDYCKQQQADPVLTAYLQQEQAERVQMKQGPRELNNSAVQLYQRGHWEQAFEAFSLAHKVMPKNAGIALNLLQTLLTSPRPLCGVQEKLRLQHQCEQVIAAASLKPEQQRRYEQLKSKQQPLQMNG